MGEVTLGRGRAAMDSTRRPFAEASTGVPEVSSNRLEATARIRRDGDGVVTLAETETVDEIAGMMAREDLRTRDPSSAPSYAYVFRSAVRPPKRSAPM